MFLLQFAILIYSVILHEIAHGWIADYLGDPTARLAGRLTLNPLPHIDPLMTIAFPLLLILGGSPVVFGAAKPVPIDAFNFREPKKDTALTSAAGPLTNILLAIFFALILRVLPVIVINQNILSAAESLCVYGVEINVILALFNLLPIPPLDGFKVVGGLVPEEYAPAWFSLERFGLFLVIIVLLFFSSIINRIIGPIDQALLRFFLP